MAADENKLILVDSVLLGAYQIEAGMYDWGSGERLAVFENARTASRSMKVTDGVGY